MTTWHCPHCQEFAKKRWSKKILTSGRPTRGRNTASQAVLGSYPPKETRGLPRSSCVSQLPLTSL